MAKPRGLSPAALLAYAAIALVILILAATQSSDSDSSMVASADTSVSSGASTSVEGTWGESTTTTPPSTTTTTAAPEPDKAPPPVAPTTEPVPPAIPESVQQLSARLAALPVGSLDSSHPYDRDLFGPAWSDTDHNGCDTRNDILHRDLTGVVNREGTHGCVVIAGRLADPYTGGVIEFRKAEASKVQIDHLVPLHAAWRLGAWQWTAQERLTYANDPRVLLAVSGSQNESKGDDLADEWRPPNRAWWCAYATRTIAVHEAYRLPVTVTERAALSDMISTCTPGSVG